MLANSPYKFLSASWHLVYYISTHKSYDATTEKLLAFKENNKDYLEEWIKWTCNELSKLDIHFDYIIRALSNDELKASGKESLDMLGRSLAQKLHSIYIPSLLAKTSATQQLRYINEKSERKKAIENVYYVATPLVDCNYKNILILDDVVTFGTTIEEIVRAMITTYPTAKYYAFTLAKASDNVTANDNITATYFQG